ncbi:MAG TPA: aminomethyl-transferring glycine dehydrogenase subunit GcvPA [Candidatus Xenobia bacterium]|jgi:glycine dehydrogenase subunit 1
MPYIPHTPEDRAEMLAAIGLTSMDELFRDIPEAARFRGALDVPPSMAEGDLTTHLRSLAAKNQPGLPCLLGAGAYEHFSPALVDSLLQRAEFYSAYTPYQPEASQGSLQVIYEFQSIISLLTGMEVANASLYEGGTATAEAVLMALNVTGRSRVLLSKGLHPHYRAVVQTYCKHIEDVSIEEVDLQNGVTPVSLKLDDDVAAVVVQNPNFLGRVEAGDELAKTVHAAGALLLVAVTDLLSLGLLRAPGDYDADVCFGEGQGLGLPLSYGGPYVGFISMPSRYVKRMPGRLAGRTVDTQGRPGFCLTLQAREQHIRREKAVSNICTNQALCALATTMYVCAMGRLGVQEVAKASHAKAHYLAGRLASVPGLSMAFPGGAFFHEWVMQCDRGAGWLVDTLQAAGFVPPLSLEKFYPELKDCVLFCATETVTKEALDRAVQVLTDAKAVVGARS